MAKRRRFVVALHEVDRAYGGPEEGGWYYDTTEPSREFAGYTRTFKSSTKAWRYCNRLNTTIAARNNAGMREVWSVLYHGGRVTAMVQKGEQPRHTPTHRPYYE
jgi:hypothetical protein